MKEHVGSDETDEVPPLPCPHCGPMPAAPELVRSDVSGRWQVFCGPCGSSSGSSRNPKDAVDQWNSRWCGVVTMPHSSAAITGLALVLGNSIRDLSQSDEPPRYGFSSKEKGLRAYQLARIIMGFLNRQMAGSMPSEEAGPKTGFGSKTGHSEERRRSESSQSSQDGATTTGST